MERTGQKYTKKIFHKWSVLSRTVCSTIILILLHKKYALIVSGAIKAADAQSEKEAIREKPQVNPLVAFLRSLDVFEGPQLSMGELAEDIIKNRSIQLASDNQRVGLDTISSPYTAHFKEARVRRNSETGNPPQSLACNVTLQGPNPVYCRLEKNGDLVLRLLDEGNQPAGEIRHGDLAAHGIPEAVFDQIHFIVLEVLKIIYVRVDAGPKTGKSNGASENNDENDNGDDDDGGGGGGDEGDGGEGGSGPTFSTDEAGLTDPRTVGRMKIDMTEMERLRRAAHDREESIRIGTNRRRVYEVFVQLTRRMPLDETPPEGVNEVELYTYDTLHNAKDRRRRVHLYLLANPGDVYQLIRLGELKPEDIYVRTGKAHAPPLAFVRKERTVSAPAEGEKPAAWRPDMKLWTVQQRHITKKARERYRIATERNRGESLAVGNHAKILYFDEVDSPNRPLTHRLFEKMADGTALRGATTTIERESTQHIDYLRRFLRARYLEHSSSPLDFARFARVMKIFEGRVKREATARAHAVKELPGKTSSSSEVGRSKTDPENVVGYTRLMLPQAGFVFEQTFNQGQFETLAELLGLANQAE